MKRLCIALFAAASVAMPAGAIDKPDRPTSSRRRYHADDQTVRHLADAAQDADARTREAAVRDLGETTNPRAFEPIARALEDDSMLVRCAAVRAAAELDAARAAPLVQRALRSGQRRLILTALAVWRQRPDDNTDALVSLLGGADADVQAAALATLTQHDIAAPPQRLTELLRSASHTVQLHAARNASLVPATADHAGMPAALRRLVDGPNAALRGAALPALCALGGAADRHRLPDALTDASPWVRRGAVRGMLLATRAGKLQPARVEARLIRVLRGDDRQAAETEMVLLAAVRAAGRLPCRSANGVSAVFETMRGAPYDDWDDRTGRRGPPRGDLHHAARTALARIAAGEGNTAVLSEAREALRDEIAALTDAADAVAGDARAAHRLAVRNARACCLLIAAVARNDGPSQGLAYGRKYLTALLGDDGLPVESKVRIELADALAAIGVRTGEPRCAEALAAELGDYRRRALAVLATPPMQRPPPYLPEATAATIDALAEIGAAEAWDDIAATALVGHGTSWSGRFSPQAAAARAAVALARPGNRAAVGDFLTALLSGANDRVPPILFEAALAAGELALDEADLVAALRRVLSEQDSVAMLAPLHACRWALERITHTAPPLPDIRPEPGEWIIRTVPRR
ncbi:MAG: HEAT repeat domain-containing protein [Phycisphaerae bacterium]|nr:HEAT repeat domain-containing protein [Phycisphaerae bacterium]